MVAFSSAGRRVELMDQFRQELAARDGGRVIALDIDPWAPAARLADEFHEVPRCDSPEFIDQVLDLCKRREVDLLIPLIDTELAVYAVSRGQFAREGILIPVGGPETIRRCNDKLAFQQLMAEVGVVTPPTAPSGSDVTVEWESGAVVKPRFGSSSVGMRICPAGTTLTSAAIADDDLVVQRRIEGTEHSVDVFVDQRGQVRSAFTRLQLHMRGGEAQQGQAIVNRELAELATRAVEALPDPFGVMDVDMMVDGATGVPHVLEVNGRFPGGYPLSHMAGAPGIGWLLDLASGNEPNYDAVQPTRPVRMSRFHQAVYSEVVE